MNFFFFFLSLFFLSFKLSKPCWGITTSTQIAHPSSTINCDDFCKQFSDAQGKTVYGLTTSNPWSQTDDLLCCDLSYGNSATSQTTSACSQRAPTAPAFLNLNTCTGLTLSSNVIRALENAVYEPSKGSYAPSPITPPTSTETNDYYTQLCIKVGALENRCLYHNSQVEVQCMAYNILSATNIASGITINLILGIIDLSISAECFAACVTGNPLALKGCGTAALLEGIVELAVTMSLQRSIAEAFDNYQAAGGTLPSGSALTGNVGYITTLALGGGGALSGLMSLNAKNLVEKTEFDSTAETKAMEKALACSSAAFYAALGGVRIANEKALSESKATACSAIQSLFSQTPSLISNAAPRSSSIATASTSGGREGSTSTTSSVSVSANQLTVFGNCLQQGYSQNQCATNAGFTLPTTSTASSSGATAGADAHLLNSPLLKSILKNAPNIGDLASKAITQDAGSALESFLPEGADAFGKTLAHIAKTAEENGQSLSEALKLGSSYLRQSKKNENSTLPSPSNTLANNLSKNENRINNQIESRGNNNSNVSDDAILHENYKDTLFTLISEKIQKMQSHVHF